MGLMYYVLSIIVTLGILITIHEWGHYWVAKRCGVKVLRFSVGFGKPIFTWKGKDDTEFAIAAIPLGGYVRMLDEREGQVPEFLKNQAFNQKTVWQRIAIVAAGPLVNLIFAVIAYAVLFMWGTQAVVPKVGQVEQGSIAEQAGLYPGLEIQSIDGHKTHSWQDVNLRLAAKIGETEDFVVIASERYRSQQTFTAQLDRWSVDLENESPLEALGITPWRPQMLPVIGQILPEGRASQAGLEVGDIVVQVNQDNIETWDELVAIIQQNPEEVLDVSVERNAAIVNLTLIPAVRSVSNGIMQGYIGAGALPPTWPEDMLIDVRYGPFVAMKMGLEKTGQMIALTLDSIKKMLVGIISVKNLSGPITIAKVAGDSASSGIETFISFLAYLSISLGILNLLPIPMLDGGHLMYYMIELIRGKPVSEQVQLMGLKIGMFLLFGLMSIAIFNDLARLSF